MKQHQIFQNGLETLRDYCAQVQKTPSTYDGDKVVTIIQSFGDSFCLHLHDEIDTLAPDKLRAIFPDHRDLKKTHVKMIRWKISHATKTTMLPWVYNLIKRFDLLDFIAPRRQERAVVAN